MDVQALRTPEFWRKINPFLTLTEEGSTHPLESYDINKDLLENSYRSLFKEGYAQLFEFLPKETVDKLRTGIENLRKEKINPCFAFVYDDYWNVYRKLRPLIVKFLGDHYYQLPEFWTWYVDKDKEESGWGPHRDRDGPSIFPDGSPKGVTLWIPLTNVSPLNGCMHIIPASKDKDYLDFTTPNREEVYDTSLGIPLEAPAGSILMWNSRLVHWEAKAVPKHLYHGSAWRLNSSALMSLCSANLQLKTLKSYSHS